MKYAKHIMTAAFAASLTTAAYAQNDPQADQKSQQQMGGETVTLQDLPSAVQKTVEKEAKGKQISSIKKEMKGGETAYRVELMGKDGKEERVDISQKGKVISRHHMKKGEQMGQQGQGMEQQGTNVPPPQPQPQQPQQPQPMP